ncbi:prepilin peptidase [Patescibacteria group bacterium]|nr:prepilin peptidase [Patescibacteria group bacterium]
MLYFLIFILGLSVGSFLNVVICRLETKESIVAKRSHCPQCGAVLSWYDLIPVLSFVFLLGKCRSCGKKISWQYPVIEITTACLFLLIFNFQFSIFNEFSILNFQTLNLFYYLIIICFLIVIFVYDLRHYIIPDKIVFPAIIIAGIFNFQFSIFNEFSIFKFSILSAILAGGFFLSLVLFSKGKWMGMGDVKLAFLMGLILGWPNILAALFLAFLTGAVVGVALIIFGKKGLKSQIPFGPFLAGATVLVMLCGQLWINFLFVF